MKNRFLLCAVSMALFLGGCAGKPPVRTELPPSGKVIPLPGELPKSYVVNGERYYPLPDAEGFIESGKASWYGHPFHGRRTSSGEVYDMYKITAAHKTLPLHTVVKVTNLSNGKHIILPVNDRGPFVKGRIIDLSYAAAREIDMIGPGVTDVSVVALGREVGRLQGKDGAKPLLESMDFQTGEFTVQIGAFENRENAVRLADRLRVVYKEVNIVPYLDGKNRNLHRVHVSLSRTLEEARVAQKKLEEMGFKDAFVLRN
ncbi:MAG: septal ring lytic transglycosylase RlpA family protein [Desulfobacteraceae bacterium]|nr:MAG: septal ring lytic transglycosylase RlpA family protein [Desulfobacteraceae bacterium]